MTIAGGEEKYPQSVDTSKTASVAKIDTTRYRAGSMYLRKTNTYGIIDRMPMISPITQCPSKRPKRMAKTAKKNQEVQTCLTTFSWSGLNTRLCWLLSSVSSFLKGLSPTLYALMAYRTEKTTEMIAIAAIMNNIFLLLSPFREIVELLPKVGAVLSLRAL